MAVEIKDGKPEETARFEQVGVNWIRPNPANPRKQMGDESLAELAESIKQHGVLEPLVVRPCDGDRYEIIAGERRWRAAQIAGLETVPVRVLEGIDDVLAVELALVENLCRQDINPIEEAEGYQALRDWGHKVTQIAGKVGRSQEAVSNTLRLLKLPETAREHMREGRLSASHGKALVSYVDYPKLLEYKMAQAVDDGATAKQLEKIESYMTPRGIVDRVYAGLLPDEALKECAECPHRRHVDSCCWLCLNPECLNAKQQAEVGRQAAEVIERLNLPAGEKLPRLEDLPKSSYKRFDLDGTPKGCKADCDKRGAALDYGGAPRVICTQPRCYNKLKREQNARAKAPTTERVEKMLAKALDRLEDVKLDDQAAWETVVATYVLERLPHGAKQKIAKQIGVEPNLVDTTGRETHELMDAVRQYFNPIHGLAGALLQIDAADAIKNDWHKPALLEWFLGEDPGIEVGVCEVCGRKYDAGAASRPNNKTNTCSWECEQKLKQDPAAGQDPAGAEDAVTDPDSEQAADPEAPAPESAEPSEEDFVRAMRDELQQLGVTIGSAVRIGGDSAEAVSYVRALDENAGDVEVSESMDSPGVKIPWEVFVMDYVAVAEVSADDEPVADTGPPAPETQHPTPEDTVVDQIARMLEREQQCRIIKIHSTQAGLKQTPVVVRGLARHPETNEVTRILMPHGNKLIADYVNAHYAVWRDPAKPEPEDNGADFDPEEAMAILEEMGVEPGVRLRRIDRGPDTVYYAIPHDERGRVALSESKDGPCHLEMGAEVLMRDFEVVRICRVCGCDDENACEGGCEWVEWDLCSACVGIEDAAEYSARNTAEGDPCEST